MNNEMNNVINIVMNKDKTQWQPEITQDGIAAILGVTRQTVVNYINHPETIPAKALRTLASTTGMSLEELCGRDDRSSGPNVKASYDESARRIKGFIQEAEKGVDTLGRMQKNIPNDSSFDSCRKTAETSISMLEETVSFVSKMGRKPIVSALGAPYTGKSTLINYLIGKEILPVGHSPMTMVTTYIFHVSEWPKFLKDRNITDNAIVVGRKPGDSKKRISYFANGFENLEPEDIIRIGNYESILKEYGTQNGVYFNDPAYHISQIYVFAEADILKELTFVDIPAFGTYSEERDAKLALGSAAIDVVFYLSTANDFLGGNELMNLCNVIAAREDLSSLYILATHAYLLKVNPAKAKSKDEDEVVDEVILTKKNEETCINDGYSRIMKALPDPEKERLGDLKERCFVFDVSNEEHCSKLNSQLEKVIPKIVEIRISKAVDVAKNISHASREKIESISNMIQVERIKQLDVEMEDHIKKYMREITGKSLDLLKDILELGIDTDCNIMKESMTHDYQKVINSDYIKKVIEEKKLKNKKNDLDELGTYLSAEISNCFNQNVLKYSYSFVNKVDKQLDECFNNIVSAANKADLSVDLEKYDFINAFGMGLSNGSKSGALKFWRALDKREKLYKTEAYVKNGKTIYVNKEVDQSSYDYSDEWMNLIGKASVTFGLSGMAGGMVAAFGAPAGLAATLLAFGIKEGIAGYGVITGDWKSRVANKIVNTYRENDALNRLLKAIDNYEINTKNAIKECIKTLSEQIENQYMKAVSMRTVDNKTYYSRIATDIQTYNACKNIYSDMLDALEKND